MSGFRVIATFTPEAWINDNAVEVDAEGPTEWDCTSAVKAHREYFDRLQARQHETFTDDFGVLDNDDVLQGDPEAPEWVRSWHGPFTIRVRQAGQGC